MISLSFALSLALDDNVARQQPHVRSHFDAAHPVGLEPRVVRVLQGLGKVDDRLAGVRK